MFFNTAIGHTFFNTEVAHAYSLNTDLREPSSMVYESFNMEHRRDTQIESILEYIYVEKCP